MPINGKVQCIDWCIHQIVAALTAGGVETVASCCGHGTQRGRIDLKDGRVLWIETPKPAAVISENGPPCENCAHEGPAKWSQGAWRCPECWHATEPKKPEPEPKKCERCDGTEYVRDPKTLELDPCPVCAFPR